MSQFLFVDENSIWLYGLNSVFNSDNCISGAPFNPDHSYLTQNIIDKIKGDEKIVIGLNIERPYTHLGKYHLQQCIGIEIFKQLRIKRVTNHIILYGFQTLHNILKRDISNSIINSKGCTYLQLPFDEKMLNNTSFDEKSDSSNFKTVMRRGAYNIDAFRHSDANFWAIKRCIAHLNRCVEIVMPDVQIGTVINYEEKYHKYYDGITIQKITEAEFVFNSEENSLYNEYNSSILDCIKIIKDIQTRKSHSTIFYFDDQYDDGWAELLSIIIFGNYKIESPETLIKPNFEIAGKGKFYSYTRFDKKYSKEEILDNIENKDTVDFIKGKSADLFIIDLRLTEKDQSPNNTPNSFTGIQLLKKLEKQFPGVPKLIISASNKIFTSKMALEEGAYDYWIKEGPDIGFNLVNSVENFQKLLKTIYVLNDMDHRCLNIIVSLKYYLQSKTDFWFTNPERWQNQNCLFNIADSRIDSISKNATNQKKGIIQLIHQASLIYKNYLISGKGGTNINAVYCPIMNLLGQVVELIHDFPKLAEEDLRYFQDFKIVLYRGDYSGKIIYDFRNFGSHYELNAHVNKYVFYTFINYLCSYLINCRIKININDIFIKTDGNCNRKDSDKNGNIIYPEKKSAFKILANVPNIKIDKLDYKNVSNKSISLVKIDSYNESSKVIKVSDINISDEFEQEYLEKFKILQKMLN